MRFFIDELEVLFPYDYVYPEQIEYMRALKTTLGKGHSVLEMPTGTGKTITLLSLLLSYQYRYPDVGKVVYCTRTVHEMTKVMAELKNLMAFRERTIIADQEEFMQLYPDLAKKTIDVLNTTLAVSDNAVEDELNAALNAPPASTQAQTTRRARRHIQVGMDDNDLDADATPDAAQAGPTATDSTSATAAAATTTDVRQHTVESAVAILVSQGFDAALATKAVLCMRSPSILGVCLSSRRNMCIHPVVSQFDHRERVDSLCRGMTAQYVRERVLGQLAAGTNASGNVSRESENSGAGCGGACGMTDLDSNSNENSMTDEIAAVTSRTSASTAGTLADIEDADRLGLCPYFEGLQSTGSDFRLKGVYDIEDLRTLGAEKMWCPYYATRQAVAQADVVVFNYQYMLDPKISSLISGSIPENSIVVFDEAHNIDNICIEAMSITLNKNDIYAAGRGLNKLRILVQECEAQNQQKLQDEYRKLVEQLLANNVENSGDILEVAGSPLLDSDMLQETVPGSIRRAKHFVVLLKTLVEYLKIIIGETAVTQQTPELFIRKYQVETGVTDPTVLKYSYDRLSILLRTLEVSDVDDYTSLLKVCSFITLCAYYSTNVGTSSFIPGAQGKFPSAMGGVGTAGSKDSFVVLFEPFDGNQLPDARLQLVCVDATIAMQPVATKYASVVITSGTITPLDMLPRILGINPLVAQSFTMSLSRDVIVPLIASKGNDQNPLSTSFTSRETPAMAQSYGQLLISLAKTVPDGMVVFFPSYIYMEQILQKWSDLGILTQLLQHKLLFLETKDIEETTLALSAYRKACSSGRGGIFFSIARGKVSEGIDFSGHLGRAVVLVGVPYQYTRSRPLLCRLDYLRDHVNIPESEYLHFDAMRQTAQCIGRIVRSKNDYGVVVLADHRYSRPDLKQKLPRWVQQFLLPEHSSLSSESVVYAGKKFFRDSCMRGDVMSEPGVKGKVLLNGPQANSYASALAQAHVSSGGDSITAIGGGSNEILRNMLLSGRLRPEMRAASAEGAVDSGRSGVSVSATGSVVNIKFKR